MIPIDAVRSFKENWCDENRVIIGIIKSQLLEYFISPILDVGSGMGDIPYQALYHKKVICIDVSYVSRTEYPVAPKHERYQIDFFRWASEMKINTILLSHSLQFLDHDLGKLNKRIHQLGPTNIVLVVNKNDGIMGILVEWAVQNVREANPEVTLEGFPNGYRLVESVPFQARIDCPSFEVLAQQVLYVMSIASGKKRRSLIRFLERHLRHPGFDFNQTIEVYTRDGQRQP